MVKIQKHNTSDPIQPAQNADVSITTFINVHEQDGRHTTPISRAAMVHGVDVSADLEDQLSGALAALEGEFLAVLGVEESQE